VIASRPTSPPAPAWAHNAPRTSNTALRQASDRLARMRPSIPSSNGTPGWS